MRRAAAKIFLLLTAVATTCGLPLVTHASCVPEERDALLAFRNCVTRDPHSSLNSWRRGTDCCRWRGITCSNLTGHVVKIDLGDTYVYSLEGQISPSLLSLQQLEYLDLSFNPLQGDNGNVPEFLGFMNNLRHLDLSGIPFAGRVPPFLGNLSKLEYLDLSYTNFSSIVPPHLGNLSNLRHLKLSFMGNAYSTDISWLTHLHFLEYLDMGVLNLSMVADWHHVMTTIPTLEFLYLSNCLLPSTNHPLSHQTNITKLRELDLSMNYLDYPITSCCFWNATSIELLKLSDTYLYGPFPNTLASMTSLRWFEFMNNGHRATMAVDLKDLCALEVLQLDSSLSPGNINELVDKLPRCTTNALRYLSLSHNNMTGSIPYSIGNLNNLTYLDLSYNNINDKAALPVIENISTSSIILDLSNNNLTGAALLQIGHIFTSLQNLDLSNNNIRGIPKGIGNFTSLEGLDLSNNDILTMPEGIGNFTSLKNLCLDKNHLTGSIPQGLGNLTSLVNLDLSNNYITGSIPQGIGNLICVEILDLSNNHLTGSILPGIWNLTSLKSLDLSDNHLSGNISLDIENYSVLRSLILRSNQLSGQIPALPASLTVLDISMNFLSGSLPLDFGTPNLQALILFSNHISGHIPQAICDLQNLLVLDLSNNFLEGKLPKCFQMPNMVFLLLRNNSFSSEFPSTLQSCSSLAFLDLEWNKFYGRLPQWIGELVYLQFLRLSHNLFNGYIPANITNLIRLQYLSLGSNNISGAIPGSLLNLRAMAVKYFREPGVDMLGWYTALLGEYTEILYVVMKRQNLEYGANIFELTGIDLSLNNLTGGIPEQITSFNGLMNLNLSWNQLDGKVPEMIGAMKSLESLDLSRNNLYGEIPTSLSDLTFLSYMDLSYNNFIGRIPSGRQLDTLYLENPSMYDGNSGLCGPPLRRICSVSNTSQNGNQGTSENYSEQKFFYFGLASGFTAGLWVVFCALLFKKMWRIAYFCIFDKVYDQLYVSVAVTWGRLARRNTTN